MPYLRRNDGWQFSSVKQNQVLAQYEKKNINEIFDELLIEKNNNENLKLRLQELQLEVDTFKAGETDVQENIKALEEAVACPYKSRIRDHKGPD